MEAWLEHYAKNVMESSCAPRVQRLAEDVFENMKRPRRELRSDGSVLNAETESLPLIIRKAMAEKEKLSRVPLGLWDGQLFAGSIAFCSPATSIAEDFPVYATEEELLEGEKYGFGVYSIFGHISPDYPRLLQLGTTGIRALLERHDIDTAGEKNRDFLLAARISLEGIELFAERYVRYIEGEVENTRDAARQEELRRMGTALARCPLHPAESYFEACQVTWLVHLILQLLSTHLAIGRPDQFLWPYLKADFDKGVLTVDEAQEITDCFMLKFNERTMDSAAVGNAMDIQRKQVELEQKWRNRKLHDIGQQRYNVRDELDATNHWMQNMMIGGVLPESGEDATNPVTVLLLAAFHRLHMTNPVLSVRLNKNTPEWFFRQVAETLKTGGGLPAVYNDELIIPSYVRFGFRTRDARDYANNGCWEVILPGKTDFYFIKLHALKCLEWTFNHGACRIDGKQEAPDQGDPGDIVSFDELYDRVMENIRFVAQNAAEYMLETQCRRSTIAPQPTLSLLLDGPVEKGFDMTDMSSRFVIGGVIAEGASHVIDSLTALKQLVFEERRYTMRQVADALSQNFCGYEAMRKHMLACPKYGANNEIADKMAASFVASFADLIEDINRNAKGTGMTFMPGIGTFSWFIAIGGGVGPSPDGRLSAAPVASNFSPSSGAMLKGVTGALHSFCKTNLRLMPLGSPIDLGLAERYTRGEGGTTRLAGLLHSFLALDGNLLTISVAETETLRKAQKNPEAYRDLRIRMGGWSAYFTMLSPEQQEFHIQKSEVGFI